MMKILFFISLFSIIYFKEVTFKENWDDRFMYLLSIFGNEQSEYELYNMLNDCIKNPKKYSTIDNMCEAIQHYKDNSGELVVANSNLIEHMKEFNYCLFNLFGHKSYKLVKKEIISIIKDKIKNAQKEGKKYPTIENAPDSERGAWYLTLGSYALNIEYKKKIDLSNSKNHIFNFKVHFYGKDLWDFESSDCDHWYDIVCFFHNLLEEKIPEVIVGKGTKFYVSYDFYDTLEVDINKVFLENDGEDEDCKSKNFQNNNKVKIFFVLLFLLF